MAQHDGVFSDYYKSMSELGYSRLEAANKLPEQHNIDPIEPMTSVEPEIDVTEPMVTAGSEGLMGPTDPAGLFDLNPETIMSALVGLTPVGKIFTGLQTAKALAGEGKDNLWSDGIKYLSGQPDTWFGGLFGEPSGQGLFRQEDSTTDSDSPWDEGSYTFAPGGYSYGTIDGIGVEDPN